MWNKIKNALHDFSIWFVVLFIIVFSIFIVNSYISHQKSLFPNTNVYGESISGAESIEIPTDTRNSLPSDRDAWGQTGDFFGGVLNPIISMGALILLFFNLRLTKGELEDTKKILHLQTNSQEKQRFEDTFFSLLNQHNNLIEKLNDRLPKIKFNYGGRLNLCVIPTAYNARDELWKLVSEKESLIRTYFRVLYQLLKFIKNNYPDKNVAFEMKYEISLKDKANRNYSKIIFDGDDARSFTKEKAYSNFVRSFIPDFLGELIIINSIYNEKENNEICGYKEFADLLSRYAFFEHFPIDNSDENFLEALSFCYDESKKCNNDVENPSSIYKEILGEKNESISPAIAALTLIDLDSSEYRRIQEKETYIRHVHRCLVFRDIVSNNHFSIYAFGDQHYYNRVLDGIK